MCEGARECLGLPTPELLGALCYPLALVQPAQAAPSLDMRGEQVHSACP